MITLSLSFSVPSHSYTVLQSLSLNHFSSFNSINALTTIVAFSSTLKHYFINSATSNLGHIFSLQASRSNKNCVNIFFIFIYLHTRSFTIIGLSQSLMGYTSYNVITYLVMIDSKAKRKIENQGEIRRK